MHARTGIGYDSHRFAAGGPLRLGGIDIPSDRHLVGHSDADAICHAVTDAILGAACLGDIGRMFPDTDPANRGRDSIDMLERAMGRVRQEQRLRVEHVDITVIVESPKIGPYRDAICGRIAEALGIPAGHVNVKAKTNEGMGWIGRGEGLACIASATLMP
ncbi:MAG: 2-C-methyl-D-erythritol 2,4-cyclodiphosphate synthase [Gemmatimonadetes bacterium]|nr:2-C-methyl-D-erythritol 2,4-cyclodiphosphate synthase [Gemmatimonadota bacterium]